MAPPPPTTVSNPPNTMVTTAQTGDLRGFLAIDATPGNRQLGQQLDGAAYRVMSIHAQPPWPMENRTMFVIREKFFSIGDDFDVLDENGVKVYRVDGKVLSVRNKVVIEDPAGNELATVHRHLVALRPTYEIRIGGEKAAEVR